MLGILLALAAQASSDKLPPAQALPPPVGNEQPVLAAVNALLETFGRGDSAAMLGLVHSDGRVTATGTRATSSGLRSESWAQFASRITPDASFQETISDPAVEVDGDAAMVWAPFVVRVAGKVSNCGIDHFDLVRDNGVWKVINLTFSSRVIGCSQQ
ncbi:MAG: nuclear transport factor 2 family protein [Sphingomicrobium sp.]